MSDDPRTAQERLQQQSLANVRALVDKLERGDDKPSWRGLAIAGATIAVAVTVGYLGLRAWAQSRIAPEALDTTSLSPAAYAQRCAAAIEKAANSRHRPGHGRPAAIRAEVKVGALGQRSARRTTSSGDSQLDEALTGHVLAGPCGAPPGGKGLAFAVEVAYVGDPGAIRVAVRALGP